MSSTASNSASDVQQQILDHLQDKWPRKEPAELEWLDSFLPAVIAVATFGGSITFTLVPGQLEKPSHYFGFKTVRVFLSLAWLLFSMALGVASVASLVLAFQRDKIKKALEERNAEDSITKDLRGITKAAVIFLGRFPVSLLLQLLLLLAFLFLGLVVAAYMPEVGWLAIGITASGTIGAVVIWWFQTRSRDS